MNGIGKMMEYFYFKGINVMNGQMEICYGFLFWELGRSEGLDCPVACPGYGLSDSLWLKVKGI
jgi:hypothetical protein